MKKNLNKIKDIFSLISIGQFKKEDLVFLNEYIEKLEKTYNCIYDKNKIKIKEMDDGFNKVFRALSEVSLAAFKKVEIARPTLRKKFKQIIAGLSDIKKGLALAFDPDIISFTNLNKEQTSRYILNKLEGLGKKYIFNEEGRYSVPNHISDLNRNEILSVLRLLQKEINIKQEKGWKVYGTGKYPIRILGTKNKIYFVYKNNNIEKPVYEKQLTIDPSKVAFVA